jgi:Tol biopolymer transport system component
MKKIIPLLILISTFSIVLISGCVQQEGDGTGNGQNGDGNEAIMPADLTQITFLEDLAADPSWSPDGSRIIFLGMDKNTYEGGFYVINSDGTGVAKVGQWGYDHLFNPSWSPVSNKIIGHGTDNEYHPYALFLIDLDGDPAEQIQLTAQKAEMPSWSPDGTRIAYNVYSGDWSSSKYGYESSSIWIMDADGSGQTQLTTEEDGFCTAPSFSYDGSKIVYLKGFTSYMPEAKSAQQDPNEIWVMNSDGSDKHVIFAPGDGSTQNIRERAWNKNDEIIFSRFWYQQVTQIWVINSDSTNPRSILKPAETFNSDVVVYDDPVWDNSGTKVALTKVTSPAMPEESWQIATFSWENGTEDGKERDSSIPFFGIAEDFNKSNDIASLTSDDLRELGVKIVKIEMEPFIWNLIEPSQGEFDFTLIDNVVSEASDSGVSILPILWPYALWDQDGKEECKCAGGGPVPEIMPKYRCKPQDMEAYHYFLKEIVERYDGDDDFGSYPIAESLKNKIRQNPVIYWRIIDEPDVGDDVTVERLFEGTLEDYVDLLKNSYEAIKEACEECYVITAPPVGSIEDYYSQILSFGAGNYCDGYTIHGPIAELEAAAGTLDKHVFADAGSTDEVDMAKRAILLAANGFSSAWLSTAPSWGKYNAKRVDGDPEKEEEFFKQYLLFKDGSKTPLYYALKILITELEYFKSVEPFDAGTDGVAGFKFYFDDKAPVYAFFIGDPETHIVWPVGFESPRESEEETVSLDFEQFLVKDLYGNEEVKSQSFTLEWSNVYFVTEISNQGTD